MVTKFREIRDSSDAAFAGVEAIEARIVWLEEEIERLKEVAAEQDRHNGTVTARCAIVPAKGGPVYIVTCPAGNERKLMGAVFAAFGTMMFNAIGDVFDSILPGKNMAEAAAEFYGPEKVEAPEPKPEGAP